MGTASGMGFIFLSGALIQAVWEGLESGPHTPCRSLSEQLTFLSCSSPPFTPVGAPRGPD